MTSKADINDVLRDDGPVAVQAAIDNARLVVRGHPTPTKSVRAGSSIEVVRTIVADGHAGSKRLFKAGHVVCVRDDFAAAAQMIPKLAPPNSHGAGLGDIIETRAPLKDQSWADRLAARLSGCGTGWKGSRDRRRDHVVQRRPCHVAGCWCGARRALSRVYTALSRLAATPGGGAYEIIHAVRPLGHGPRSRGMAPRHAQILGEGAMRFDELRAAPSVTGALAWSRTEALYGPWEGVVVAVLVTTRFDAMRQQLPGWILRRLGAASAESRRGLAGWLASYAALRLAPELSIGDRARCLVDEYVCDRKGSLVYGLLHGSALNALERRSIVVDGTRHGADDAEYAPPPTCVCGARLSHDGDCDPAVLRASGWTPSRRYRLALPDGSEGPRWLDRRHAEEAAGARVLGEALASFK